MENVKQIKRGLFWFVVVLAGVLLLPFFLLHVTSDHAITELVLLILATPIFIAAAVLNWRRLTTQRRRVFSLIIGWQVIMLILFANLYLPDTFVGEIGRARTAEAFMSAWSAGDFEEVMELSGREEADRVSYNVIVRKYERLEHVPVSWEFERRDGRKRLNGTAVFSNGQEVEFDLSLSWSEQEARWIISRVDLLGDDFYSIHNPRVDNSALPLDWYIYYHYIDFRMAVELIAVFCLGMTAVFIVVNPLFFIDTFRRRIKVSLEIAFDRS